VSKLGEDVRIGILGAVAGLFTGSVTLLISRIDSYYAYLSWIRETDYASYDRAVENLWWVPACLSHMLLSTVASLLVHRYWRIRFNSPFLLWQLVGITSLCGWGLTLFLIVGLEYVMNPEVRILALERIVASFDAGFIAKYVATIFACNVLYGSVINASYRQYTYQLESEVALQCRADELLQFQR
jgi:hypothetical protein